MGASWSTLKGLICESAARDVVFGLSGMELTFPKAAFLVLCRSICSWKGVGSTVIAEPCSQTHSLKPTGWYGWEAERAVASPNSCHPHVLLNPDSYSVPAVLSVAMAWGAGVKENCRFYSKDGSWELPQGFLVPHWWISLKSVYREQAGHSAELPGWVRGCPATLRGLSGAGRMLQGERRHAL